VSPHTRITARAIGVAAVIALAIGAQACAAHGDAMTATTAGSGSSSGSATEDFGHDDPFVAQAASDIDSDHAQALGPLLAMEEHRRAAIDWATFPASDATLGPDPYRVARLPDGTLVGLLRGDAAIVALAPDGRELARAAAPASPSGLAIAPDGELLVVGEAARELARYRLAHGHFERLPSLAVDALGMRDVAVSPDGATAYLVEDHDGRLLAVSLATPAAAPPRELARCHGPTRVAAVADIVAIDCLLDHAVELRRAAGTGEPIRIAHDGPMWGFAVARRGDGTLVVATAGVEDHPLVREDGGFGYIDSFVTLYTVAPGAAAATRAAVVNTSELGVVTPKWLALATTGAGAAAMTTVTTAGYATAGALALTWRADLAAPPTVARRELPPGTADASLAADGSLVAANPLLDAWIVAPATGAPRIVATPNTPRSRDARPLPSRLGELLFFTTAMAPWNSSRDQLSRFTCETCHFEGYGDGRVHYTGRANVHAATRPLRGLGNLRPYFSRALDTTMTRMVHAEFRVANRHDGRDPWSTLTTADLPWLADAGVPASLPPELLRQSLMTFLVDFTQRTNPATVGRDHFTATERAGAEVFRDRCASCHAPRLVADIAASAVPFERWESLVMSPAGPITWSDAGYHQTGVLPYVIDRGTRTPPLRRLYKKWPYFTNGTARSLADLVDRFTFDATGAQHDGGAGAAAHLDPAAKAALLAFLDLL
jgi:mono/diheme cytochrome c family protein